MIGKADTLELLKEQCARYANGFCHTRRCLVRGGYRDGPAVDHEATCEFHEAVVAVEDRERLRALLKEFRDYASEQITSGGAHHNPIWARVADELETPQ